MVKPVYYQRSGFSVVELLVVIVVIGILAGLAYVGYNGVQAMATDAVVKQNLKTAAQAVQMAVAVDNFPGSDQIVNGGADEGEEPRYIEGVQEILDSLNTPSDMHVQLPVGTDNSTAKSQYVDLTPVQNSVLFYNICGQLINEGYGKAKNNGGQVEQYISACNVYNSPELQINSAWSGHVLNVPVSASELTAIASSINYHDDWRPDRDQAEKDFYTTWDQRFLDLGGSYPVTTFWDPWANQWSGVQYEDLPDMQEVSTGSDYSGKFCLEAWSDRYPDRVFHLNELGGAIKSGQCV